MVRFRDRYRIESSRRTGWDYGSPWWYYVTLCTKKREPHFGMARDGEMVLSPMGETAKRMWAEIPEHFPQVRLDAFVVMPDHLHGLLLVMGDPDPTVRGTGAPPHGGSPSNPSFMSAISPLAGTLPVVIRSYKSAVTYWCHHNGYPDFAWQERYYDRIVQFGDIPGTRVYIVENPKPMR